MINDYDKGGLKMVDTKSFSETLKLKWIGKYLDNDNQSKWNSSSHTTCKSMEERLFFNAISDVMTYHY